MIQYTYEFVGYKEGPVTLTRNGYTAERQDVTSRNPDGTRADFSFYAFPA